MYSPVQLAVEFAKYYVTSVNLHGIHSPFVYALTEQVIYNSGHYYSYKTIENLRSQLLEDNREIDILDLGAGSKFGNTKKKRISAIAKNAAKPVKFGQLIFRLCDYLHPKTVLELGTSLGLTTAYLAAANSESKIYSLEGCPETAKTAADNFKKLNLKNIQQIVGNFDDTLPQLIPDLPQIDLAFFDGNHRYKPTMEYFHSCLPKATNDSLFIFDDIHWSQEMEQAWEEIKAHPSVSLTIDLFFIGLVFFKKGREKEHFVIRF